ncbi:acyl-CoA N-acyltransferase [Penicillium riverlandense]|uniref:acyl-CoA N-acyltransferase n=1 Tax=Penicillium riverlandense TaxID=1903569 RepID=UPI002547C268|nr:acyl-CoA N-acyltransferase [Penicillium riverlandense]KAJ5831795.1 acyl-CoA N-acyltransferase [Penicillium riverlandense]
MSFSLLHVQASDAERLIRECDFPAMLDNPIRLTMFPHSGPETQEDEIRWMTCNFKHSLEEDSSNFRKICTEDGTPVGFAGYAVLNNTVQNKIQKGQVELHSNPEPETLDKDTWSEVSKMLMAEQNRVIHGQENIWSLTIVAVNPMYQRRGIGSMLMKWACEEADKAHRDGILLSSPAGIQLYTKFGFEKVSEVRTPKGSLYSMFRKAQNFG